MASWYEPPSHAVLLHGVSSPCGTLWSSTRICGASVVAQPEIKGRRNAPIKAIFICLRQRCFERIEFTFDLSLRHFEGLRPLFSFGNCLTQGLIQLLESEGRFFVCFGCSNCAISLADNFVEPRFRRRRFVPVAPDGGAKPSNESQNTERNIDLNSSKKAALSH